MTSRLTERPRRPQRRCWSNRSAGRGHVVWVALNGAVASVNIWVLSTSPSIRVRAQQAPAMMQAEEEPRPRAMGMGFRLHDLQGRIFCPPCRTGPGRAVHQIARCGGCGAVRRRDVQLIALQRSRCCRVTARPSVEAGAYVGAGSRNRNFDLHRPSPFSHASGQLFQHQLHAAAHGLHQGCLGHGSWRRPAPPDRAAVKVLIHHTAPAVDDFHHGGSNTRCTHILSAAGAGSVSIPPPAPQAARTGCRRP